MTQPPHGRRRAAKIVACVAAWATGLAGVVGLTLAGPTAASAADLTAFEPGIIISDSIFFDSTTMTAADVQAFLSAKGASCVATSGNTCLKNYVQTTTDKAADSYCAAYKGAPNERASDIIAKVAVACGINPQVLLVTMQKEQSLVSATAGKSPDAYKIAMGFGCPDSSVCDSLYYGFFNQVYSAARQFQRYTKNPGNYGYQAGMLNTIKYNPNAACGSSQVFIQNQATADLYIYTPYQPNAAALAAGYGTGDSCSSYGNRNFWNFFTDWFGSTTQRDPFGSIDIVAAASPTLITVAGWALDPDTTASINVHVYIDGAFVAAPLANGSRPDVGAAFHKGDNHGFYQQYPSQPGTHQVCLYAMDSTGHGPNPSLGCRSVTLVNHTPIGSVDTISGNATSITVAGWALDPDTTDPANIHVYIDNQLVGTPAAGSARTDIGRIFGKGDNHGFYLVYPVAEGSHQVCVYVMDTLGRGPNPLLACRTVAVLNHTATGSVDTVSADATSITVAGWALDPDTTASINVHVYVDDTFVAAPLANASRPDVGKAYGKGDAHGFYQTYPTAQGTHSVCLYAMDSGGHGPNPLLACRTVKVVNQAPIGSVDTVAASPTAITVAGWALDPDTTASINVNVYIDDQLVGAPLAAALRSDVGKAFGKGDAHGFYESYPVTAGTHTVCLYAMDSTGHGPNPLLTCRTVTD
ncbi:MAG TPA: hypothetical protein VGC04_13690 [Cellulomonas sp.]